MSGERVVMLVEVTADDEGRMDVRIDSELDQATAHRVLAQIVAQANPNADRADEVEAFGAARRRR